MGQVAIVIDGSDEPARNGRVEFAVATVPSRHRPLAGLALAVLTVLVGMGAMGPRDATGPAPGDTVTVRLDPYAGPDLGLDDSAAATDPSAWWKLPAPRTWVDPLTGRLMQESTTTRPRVMDHRGRDR